MHLPLIFLNCTCSSSGDAGGGGGAIHWVPKGTDHGNFCDLLHILDSGLIKRAVMLVGHGAWWCMR